MSLYKRGPVWHYDFMYLGERFRGSTKQSSLSKARTVEAQCMADARNNHLAPNRAPLVSDLAQRFEEWLESSRLRHPTKRYYRNGWRMLKATPLVSLRLNQITNDECSCVTGSPFNINNALRTLRRMLGKAQEWKLIRARPHIALVEEHGRETVYTDEQESKLLSVAEQPLRDVLLCILDAGMRPAEIFRMRVEDIDWNQQRIFVPWGKTKNSRRFVPMTSRLAGPLLVRCANRTEGWVFPAKTFKDGRTQSPSGHITTVEKQWITARTKAALPSHAVLYCARHTFGTRVYQETGNLKATMNVMGHGDISTTMRYQHPEVDLVRSAIEGRNRVVIQ